ncbi:MAG: hypothetical protein KKD39_03455, partial [Candidatus Altiarchaeota archaeon]|nr:hypothetical protein [Candidatus Altiarchaeota archaeon]
MADIYRNLPGKDCGKGGKQSPCGLPMCKDFTKPLLKGDKTLYDCPFMEDDDRQAIILILEDYYKG